MKKTALILISLFVVVGCATKSIQPVEPINANQCFVNAPEWVMTADYKEGAISSVGAAQIGKAGIPFARTEANANARDELARTLTVKVNNMFKSFTQTTGTGDEETVDKLAVNVSKQVASTAISGSRAASTWISQCNELYVLFYIDSEVIKNETKKVLTSNNENALWIQFQAKNAIEEMEAAVEKEFSETQKPTVQ